MAEWYFKEEWLARNYQTEIVRIFECELNKGANIDQTGEFGYTLLINATIEGQDEVVEFLIQRGANLDMKDMLECTALMYAVWNRRLKYTQLLLEFGADATMKTKINRTALSFALQNRTGISFTLQNNSISVTELLLPYVDVEKGFKNNESVQELVKKELSRLQAVKDSLGDLFHDQLLEEVCDFLVSEEKMKAWLPSRKRKRED